VGVGVFRMRPQVGNLDELIVVPVDVHADLAFMPNPERHYAARGTAASASRGKAAVGIPRNSALREFNPVFVAEQRSGPIPSSGIATQNFVIQGPCRRGMRCSFS